MTATPTAVDGQISVGRGARRLNVAATWWRPPGTPHTWLWLQHGFARSRRHLASLAAHYAANGVLVLTTSLRSADLFGRTVQRLRDNTRFLTAFADALAHEHHVLASQGSAANSGPLRLCLAGHSAGADAVAYVAGQLVADGLPAAAVVLLDPVRSATGTNLATGLQRLSGASVPVRIVAAAPSRCNANGSGVAASLQHLSGFAGVRLTSGSHTDAEGPDTDWLAARLCGSPAPDNVAALRDLSTAWITTPNPEAVGPGSPLVTGLIDSGRGSPLWGQNGSMSTTR